MPPSLTRDLLEHASARVADFSRLRYWIVGGDTCPAAVHALMADVVRKPLLEICGMTETGFYCISPPHGPSKPGSIGQAMMGVAVRVVTESGADAAPGEVGRVLVRTPDMMVGYWNDTLATHSPGQTRPRSIGVDGRLRRRPGTLRPKACPAPVIGFMIAVGKAMKPAMFQKPIDFSGDTAIQRLLPGVFSLRAAADSPVPTRQNR
jgi:acyl-CoA synthetase (AMP-forming)/AMP-acid ligase II